MLLHLLRHAHAGDPAAWEGPDDVRPLSDKGRAQAERLGKFLARVGFRTDAIVSSPKRRALETAEIVAGHLGTEVTVDDRLAGGVDLAALEAVLEAHGNPGRPMLVGHDPDFSELLGTLCEAEIPMRKGALARVEVGGALRPGAGILRWLVPPDLLKPEG
jgi:phosphohistidine phosphatase